MRSTDESGRANRGDALRPTPRSPVPGVRHGARYEASESRGLVNNDGDDAGGGRCIEDKTCKCFTCCGIPVRVHIYLPIFIVFSFVQFFGVIKGNNFGGIVCIVLIYNVALWLTVLIHEYGHALAGWAVGGHTDKIVLWPLGGLAYTARPPNGTRCESILISAGGPLTHIPGFFFWFLPTAIFAARIYPWHAGEDGQRVAWQPECTSHSEDCPEASGCATASDVLGCPGLWAQGMMLSDTPTSDEIWYNGFMMAMMTNLMLFLINLFVPAYPLDGSKIFVELLRMKWDRRTVANIYIVVNGVIGIGCIILANTVYKQSSYLFMAGLWAFFQAYQMTSLTSRNQEQTHPLLIR